MGDPMWDRARGIDEYEDSVSRFEREIEARDRFAGRGLLCERCGRVVEAQECCVACGDEG